MVTAIVGVVILVLIGALIFAVARDPGPSPDEVALGYEEAWDRLDFTALWDLAGDELRDGLGRTEFVAAKRKAYADQPDLGGLAANVALEHRAVDGPAATVETRVELRDGTVARNEVQLTKRTGRWVVVGYQLRSTNPPGH